MLNVVEMTCLWLLGIFLTVYSSSGLPTMESNKIISHRGFNKWSTDAGHVPRLSELANGLLLRLMVVVEETLKDLGVSPEELREVQRKRSYITACYFQAVTCY
ncbi:uncharacterized protein LOC144618305 [Crassostrea virginica]